MHRQTIGYYFIISVVINSCTALSISLDITVKEDSKTGKELLNLRRVLNEKFKLTRWTYQLISPQEVVYRSPQLQTTFIKDAWIQVHKSTGVLTLVKSIDRESLCGKSRGCKIKFKVFAKPVGNTKIQPCMVQINAEVEDINDNAPIFPQQQLTRNLSENRLLDEFINLDAYQAKDNDIGENSKLRYELLSNPYFKIHSFVDENNFSHLQLKLRKNLDFESERIINLTIKAIDAGQPPLSNSMRVIIYVIDENDNYPIFEKARYRVTVNEGSSGNSEIIRIRAADIDTGKFGQVEYYLSTRNSPIVRKSFRVNRTTGAVILKEPLDRESSSSLQITVEARDCAVVNPKSTEGFIEVTVQDVNDNAPQLEIGFIAPHDGLKAFLLESSNSISYLASLSVKDGDSGINGQVDISLSTKGCNSSNDATGQRFFTLTQPGVLQSTRSFDREMCGAYSIILNACDRGRPSRCASETVQVEILDSNEFAPVFSDPTTTAQVTEDAPVGYTVATVKATDYDNTNSPALTLSENDDVIPSKNGEITYAIERGGGGHFVIGRRDGVVKIKRALNRETNEQWELVISATDGGSPPKKTTTNVTIQVQDVNDNAPRFIHPSRNDSTVYAYFSQSQPITTIKAIDIDGDENGKITFGIADVRQQTLTYISENMANATELFLINQISGELRLNLSSENTSQRVGEYQLVIEAKDKGKPTLRSYLLVNVIVHSNPKGVGASPPSSVITSSVFKDPFFMSILLGSVVLLLSVFVVLALVRCKRFKNGREATLAQVEHDKIKGVIESKLEYPDNSLPYDIFRPESCPSVATEPQDNNVTKDTNATTTEESSRPKGQLCPQQSDSDSGRGDSDLDGTCATQTSGKAPVVNPKCGVQCRTYGHGDSCWMPDEDEDVKLKDVKLNQTIVFSENNSYNTHYGQRSAVTNHHRPPLQKANSFGHGSYSSLAVNLNVTDNFSLPRRLPERPHSNPSIHETRIQTQSPNLDAMGLNIPEAFPSAALLYSSNPSIANQRSYSLKDDRTNRIQRMPRRHLETVYETEDSVPSSSSSGNAPLLVRQNRVISPFPYSSPTFQDAPSTIYSFYPNAMSPHLSIVTPIVTAYPNSNITVHEPEHKIANYEYML